MSVLGIADRMNLEIISIVSYGITILITTVILWRGMALIISELKQKDSSDNSFLMRSLCESATGSTQDGKPSFNRVAASLGALGTTSIFIGIGYWLIYDLFFVGNLSSFESLYRYFLFGSALFFPYAFSKLVSVFKR